jgi:hypothetical protein
LALDDLTATPGAGGGGPAPAEAIIEPGVVQSFFKHKNEFYRVKKRDLFLKPFMGVF